MGIGRIFLRGSKLMSRDGLRPFIESRLAGLPAGAAVLNVGAGGEVADLLGAEAARRGLTVTSTDIDPARAPDLVDDITASSLASETFDAVLLCEVLEHVEAPGAAISEIHRLLRPGGMLIASAPFLYPIHDRPADYYRFTRYGLERLLGRFAEVNVAPRVGWAETLLALAGRLVQEKGRRRRLLGMVMVPFLLLFYPLARLLSRLVPADFITIGYVVTARKADACAG